MYLKKDKHLIAMEAGQAARRSLMNNMAVGYSTQPSSIMGQLVDLIAKAVEEGVRETLINMYTDDDFEKDVGLKS